jgi:hypothetical protein
MKTSDLLLCIAVLSAILFQCAPDRLGLSASGGSGTETVGGYAFDAEKKPAAGIFVSVRRSDFLDTGSASQQLDVFMADTVTDTNGRFSLLVGQTGQYTVTLYDDKGNYAAMQRCTLNQDDSLYLQANLKPTGMMSGRISPAPDAEFTSFFIYLYGCARHSIRTDSAGDFEILGLPEGEYQFKAIPQHPLYESYYSGNIAVAPDSNTLIAAIKPQKSAFSINPLDSMVVRDILDSNGLRVIKVGSVVKVAPEWPYRVTELSIRKLSHNLINFQSLTSRIGELSQLRKMTVSNNVMLRSLPKEIGLLSRLKELYLNKNSIVVFPPEIGELDSVRILDISENTNAGSPGAGALVIPLEIGNLVSLETLDVHFNNLTALPSTIGNCRNLKTINASSCKLNTLPGEIAGCSNLEFIDVEYNQITSLPLSITGLGGAYDRKFINFSYNDFCQLYQNQIPEDVFKWLDKFATDPIWRTHQNCLGYCIPEITQ